MTDQKATIVVSTYATLNRSQQWKLTTLGEVVEITSSKRIFAEEYVIRGIPFYRSKEVIEKFDGNEVSTDLYISEERFSEIKKRFGAPEEGDMLLTSVGTLGIPYLVGKNEQFYFKDGNLTWFKNFKNIENIYLYYWIISDLGKEQLARHKIGSTQQALTIARLKSIPVLLPPPVEQKAITAILTSLDSKIELLREQNKTLEIIAQSLFKEWFVDFNFPNEQGQPYQKNKGDMVKSELGIMPKSWRVGALGDIVDIKGGSTPSTKISEFWNGNLAWTSPKDLADNKALFLRTTNKKITQKGLSKISSGLLPLGTILLSSRAPIGYMAISAIPVAINQGYIAILPRDDYPSFFMFLWIKYYMSTIISAANGSTFLEISKASFKRIRIVCPPVNVVTKFVDKVTPLFYKIQNNEDQISTLSHVRDLVLPRLMRGELHVQL